MGHLTTAEADRDFDLVSFFKESAGVLQLDVEVVLVGFWTELDLFYGDGGLGLSGGGFFLFLLVLHLPEITDLTDRWAGVWRHFDKIEASVFGQANRIFGEELTQLVALFVDDEDARGANLLIDTGCIFIDLRSKTFTWTSPQEISRVVEKVVPSRARGGVERRALALCFYAVNRMEEKKPWRIIGPPGPWMVGTGGIEPPTPAVSGRCSPTELRAFKGARLNIAHRQRQPG